MDKLTGVPMDKVYTTQWTLRALIGFVRLFNANVVCAENGDLIKLNVSISGKDAIFNFETYSPEA